MLPEKPALPIYGMVGDEEEIEQELLITRKKLAME